MFTDVGMKEIKKLTSLNENSLKEFKNKINSIKVSDNKEVLRNLSKSKLLGFVMSCMILNDWTNDHAQEDQEKAKRNKNMNTHEKSLLAS